MRVYLAFFQTNEPGGGGVNSGFWPDILRSALHEAGHTVLESPGLDWAEGIHVPTGAAKRDWRARVWPQALADLARFQADGGVDLFLSYFFPEQVEPAAIAEINRRGIPTVNFFCDNVREFRRVPPEYRPFQLHWVPEWESLALYQAARLPYLHAPMPIWVPPALRGPPAREDPAATFLGSRDPLRAELFSQLAGRGVRLRVQGRGWDASGQTPAPAARRARAGWLAHQWRFGRQHGLAAWLRKFRRPAALPHGNPPADWIGAAVDRAEYLRLTRESAVTVGVNRYDSPRLRPGEIATYSRLRDIEAPMLGACYLTEWAPGLDRLYDLDREIAVYRDAAELAGQLRALLADAPRRQALRRAGQARALREHTAAATLSKIVQTLGLP